MDDPSRIKRKVRLGFSEIASNDINSDIREKFAINKNMPVDIAKDKISLSVVNNWCIGRNINIAPIKSRSKISEIVQRVVNTFVAAVPSRIFIKRRNIAGKKSGITNPPQVTVSDVLEDESGLGNSIAITTRST